MLHATCHTVYGIRYTVHAACYTQTANTVLKRAGRGLAGERDIKPNLANRMQQLSAWERTEGQGSAQGGVFRKDYLPMQPDITRNTLALPLQMDG